jgi:hypothetical protein
MLYQKYFLPGLPVTTLCEPMLTYMKSYAEIGGGRTISAMPAINSYNTADWTEKNGIQSSKSVSSSESTEALSTSGEPYPLPHRS